MSALPTAKAAMNTSDPERALWVQRAREAALAWRNRSAPDELRTELPRARRHLRLVHSA
jgi:hypothetical protein